MYFPEGLENTPFTITKKLPDVWDPKTTHENIFKTVSHRKDGNNYLGQVIATTIKKVCKTK